MRQPSQEDLMSLLSNILIDYMASSKDRSLVLLDALLDAAPSNAVNPARFYFAFLQVSLSLCCASQLSATASCQNNFRLFQALHPPSSP